MTLRRGGTPLMGGVPSLEASNQSQINDLVQRNRTLEHTNKKLSEQLSQELSRSKDTVLELQSQWEINQSNWKQTCETLLGSYRIIQKRIQVELEKEKVNTLKEMKITREEKLLRLQRDFKISLFQIKEEELERRVEDVEDEKMKLMETNGLIVQKIQEKCADYVIQLRDTQASLSRAEEKMEQKETKLNKLVEGRANLEASSESVKSKLERTKLQLDGAQSKNSELERLNDELKRTNTELTRQLEKWQSLETKEGEAADTERKQRIALEMELRDLRETSEKKVAKATADLERASGRVDRMKITVHDWEEAFGNVQSEAENSQKQLAKAHKRIEKLQSELEVERARNRKASTPPQHIPLEDDEPVEMEPPSSPSPPPPRRVRADSSSKQVTSASVESHEHPHSRVARKSAKGKPPPRPARSAPQDDNEIEEISDPNEKEGKTKATEYDRDAASRKKGKRKATSDDDDDIQVMEPPKKQKTGRAGSETARARTKPSSRAASKQPAREEKDSGGADVAQKNVKKRKINIFPAGNDVIQFSFGGQLNDGLNIPTTLSPVKEDELVPTRSMSSMMSRR